MNLTTSTLGALALFAAATIASAESDTTFRYGGVTYAGETLPQSLRQRLHEIALEAAERSRQEIDRYVLDLYVTERAVLADRPVDDVRQELIFGPPPDEATLRAFYDDNKDRIGAPFEQVKDQLTQFLAQRIAQENVTALLSRIAAEKGYVAEIEVPRAPKLEIATEGYPVKGGAEAEVTIIEFADFQCPYCEAATTAIDNLMKIYGDRIRVVFRDLPVNPSGVSRKVAEGGVCAAAQGAFWPYHDRAFSQRADLTAETPPLLAAELGLDADDFAACLADEATTARVAASEAEALSLGVTGTPTFFVEGRLVSAGPDLEAALAAAIEAELAEAR